MIREKDETLLKVHVVRGEPDQVLVEEVVKEVS
jgi:hypothetical protein